MREVKPQVARFTQWSEAGGVYLPVGNTKSTIEPGHYDIGQDQTGKPVFIPTRSRTDDLLIFPDSASDQVLAGIEAFWQREEIFHKYGMPFKRGIILYGPPGSGKTCTLQLVARDVIDRGGVVLTFPDDVASLIAAYRALRDIQPDIPVVVLMEDFDVLVQMVNESRLLNMLDGVEHMHKIVFLATTNYPERLDPRIINRPSRFDVRIHIPQPNEIMRRQYLENLVLDGDSIDIDRYVRDTNGMSLAHVKELFVSVNVLCVDYQDALRRLQHMMRTRVTSLDDNPYEAEMALVPTGGYA